LVVDDNTTNLDVAKGMMKPYGMHIDCVTGGQQAIDAIRDEKVRYNAIFMDHMMPGMDGIEATRRIREIGTDYAGRITIIACTANALAGNEEMFLHKGFQAFLSKPIEMNRLDEILHRWVRDKEQESGFAEESICDERSEEGATNLSGRHIDGINLQKALERFGGDNESLLDVLRSYAVNTKPLLGAAQEVDKDNLAEYAITVHGIKGSSQGIFAEAIGAQAEALEHAAKSGDFAFVSANNPKFLEAAHTLISGLEGVLGKISMDSPKPKKDKPDEAVLAKLLAACDNYDMDGVDAALTEIERYAYENDSGLAAWLRENAELMNFQQIIEKLRVVT
jgi:CheY-like chemotaxis protein